jgi:hypothetical protein
MALKLKSFNANIVMMAMLLESCPVPDPATPIQKQI